MKTAFITKLIRPLRDEKAHYIVEEVPYTREGSFIFLYQGGRIKIIKQEELNHIYVNDFYFYHISLEDTNVNALLREKALQYLDAKILPLLQYNNIPVNLYKQLAYQRKSIAELQEVKRKNFTW